jgi:hypothetical protein
MKTTAAEAAEKCFDYARKANPILESEFRAIIERRLENMIPLNEPALSLRDEFAMRAMQALLIHWDSEIEVSTAGVAQMAYDMAEAMMEQREKRP